jgi:hypothetical protein
MASTNETARYPKRKRQEIKYYDIDDDELDIDVEQCTSKDEIHTSKVSELLSSCQ